MTKPDAEPMTNIATDVIEGYKTGLAGGPMGFVSAAFDCGWLTGAHERAALSEQPSPIDMVLHCPVCGVQHIDAPEFNGTREDKFPAFGEDPAMSWTNPPHRSHLCHGCGHIWRPADVATNGVAAIKTRGKNDSPMGACAHPVAHPAPVERVTLSEEDIRHCANVAHGRGPNTVDTLSGFSIAFARAVIAEYERLNGISATPRQPLSEARIEDGRHETFSTNNPFCPCDSKTMLKAVRWAERAHGITPAHGKETHG